MEIFVDLFINKFGNVVGNIIGFLFVLLKFDMNFIVFLLRLCNNLDVIGDKWVFV